MGGTAIRLTGRAPMCYSFIEKSNAEDVMQRLISSESVTEGHPDKVCDLIADSILDAALEKDGDSRIACEVACATGLCVVLGEFETATDFIDVQKIARGVIAEVGYTDPNLGFDHRTCAVLNCINGQSPDIACGVLSSDRKSVV